MSKNIIEIRDRTIVYFLENFTTSLLSYAYEKNTNTYAYERLAKEVLLTFPLELYIPRNNRYVLDLPIRENDMLSFFQEDRGQKSDHPMVIQYDYIVEVYDSILYRAVLANKTSGPLQ